MGWVGTVRTRAAILLSLLIVLSGIGPDQATTHASSGAPTEVYFPVTGHHVAEPFLSYWRMSGALPIFGFPMTELLEEDGLKVQYFERARFEHHPDLASVGFPVLLEHLGREILRDRDIPDAARTPSAHPSDNPRFRYFAATGFHIAHGFRSYWEKNGGLAVFGYPLTTEFVEDGRTVQYFERARFEWWPEHQGTPYEVQLGRLGADFAARRGIDRSAVPRRAGVPDYDPRLFRGEIHIPVLMYHQFGEPAGRYRIPMWRFEQQLDWLVANGYETVSLKEVFDFLDGKGNLPPKPVVITIDDGHPSQWMAAEALDRRGMIGVFFITTRMGRLSDDQIRSLSQRGHDIQAHSATHADLRWVSDAQLRFETEQSKRDLEAILGKPVLYFAYPYGSYDGRVVRAAQAAGYQGALAAWGGKHWTPEKRWEQPRIEIGGTISLAQFIAYVQ
jgi:peptidoglycan/xylan/chitin deacetylase (PgdA/CDA1 family)